MIKYFKIGSRDDSLAYYVLAPNKDAAIKVVEALIGPMNPARVRASELSAMPEGYTANGEEPQILEEDYEEE